VDLKFSFRRTVDSRLRGQWQKLVQIASSVQFEDKYNAII
jgi:hypothetical protein